MRTSTRRLVPLAAVLAVVCLAACSTHVSGRGGMTAAPFSTGSASPQPAFKPCQDTADISAPPKRIVAMDAGAAAFVIALGFGDRLVGLASPDFKQDFTGELREQLDQVPVISQHGGNKEVVLASRPDLVTGISEYEFGYFQGTPTEADLRSNGATGLVACYGTAAEQTNIDATYRYVDHLSRALGATQRGAELMIELRRKVAAATPAPGPEVPVLILSSVPDGGTGIATSGGSSFANGVVRMAGGRNIAAASRTDFTSISAEQVSTASPKVIVAETGFTKQSDSAFVAALRASPLLASTDAARTGNIVVVPQRILLSPSLLNADAIGIIGQAVKAARG